MSYDTLAGANWSDPAQLPDFLWLTEGNTPFLYNDGKGNATIGIGLNLKNNPSNMAIVLGQMSYGGKNLFAAAAANGISASIVVTTFENVLASTPLSGPADGGNYPLVWNPNNQNVSTVTLENNLNSLLAGYFGVSFNTLTSSTGSVTFTNFPSSAALIALQQALVGVASGTFGNYPAIAGYSAAANSYLTTLVNGHAITVPSANLPPVNSGAWEALVSLYFNSQTKTIGAGLLTALADNNLAQAWYQIRYQTNGADASSVAARRYAESQLFGLPSASTTQAIQAYEMLTEHRDAILLYEQEHGTDPNTAENPTVPENQILGETGNINYFNGPFFQPRHGNPTLAAPVLPIPTLDSAFIPEAELLLNAVNAVSSAVTGGIGDLFDATNNKVAGTFMVRSTDIFVAPDSTDISEGFGNVVDDNLVGPGSLSNANHLILGPDSVNSQNANEITLAGGGGNDIIIAGAGAEELDAGSGSDTLIGGQGLGSLSAPAGNDTLNGGTGLDTFDLADPTGVNVTETIGLLSGPNLGKVEVSSGNNVPTLLGGSATNPLKSVAGVADEWSDGTGAIYTYTPYAPDSFNGVLSINGGSALGGNQIVISNFELGYAQSSTGDVGIFIAGPDPTLSYSASASGNAPDPPITQGAGESFTFSVDAPSTTAQTVAVTLSGANPSDFLAIVGGSIEQLNGSGTFNLTLPAGETNVAFTLQDATADNGQSDIASGATLSLTASIADPDTLVGGSVQSGALTFSYVPEGADTAPSPIASDPISGVYNPGTGVTTYTGDGGDDFIQATGTANFIAAQSSGNDSIVGGSQVNTIQGGSGNDVINLSGSTDLVSLGSGFNTVNGGAGHDTITSVTGDDLVIGNGGTDIVTLGNGNSAIYAGAQTPLANAIGSAGAPTNAQGDFISVADDNNIIVGGNGNDFYSAGSGNDVVVMGSGSDTFIGGYETTGVASNWSSHLTNLGDGGIEVDWTGVSSYNEYYQDPFAQPYFGGVDRGTGTPNSAANDTVFGGSGNDVIDLGNGSNYVDTGSGNDDVLNGMGEDTVILGSGNDFVAGGGGTEYIEGGSGADTLQGGDGSNTIIGGSGNSTINSSDYFGGQLNFAGANLDQNYVDGGSGNDVIYGSDGQDTLIAGSGNTTIYGQMGQENIVGGSGNDLLVGGSGNDTITAGDAGIDTLSANGTSTSTSFLYGGSGADYITGASGANVIYAGDGGTAGAATSVFSSQSDPTSTSTIYGGLGVDYLEAGDGSNVIYAGDGGTSAAPTTVLGYISGSDTLYGGDGTDLIQGGSGTNVLYAGDGGTSAAPTTVIGGTGVSTLVGGAGPSILQDVQNGQDLLQSSTGDDSLIGVGSDTLVAGSGDDLLQSNGGSVSVQINPGFGDDTIIANGGTSNLVLGSGLSATDFTGAVTADSHGNIYLELDGDGGSISIEGAFTGGLNSASYVGGAQIPLQTLLTDVLGGDDTVPVGNDILIVSLADDDSIVASGSEQIISSWGASSTLSAGLQDAVYSTGADARITSGGLDQIRTTGAGDTVNGSTAGGDEISVTGGNSLVNIGVNLGSGYITSVTVSGSNDTVSAGYQSVTSQITVNDPSTVIQVAAGAGAATVEASVSYTAPTNVSTLILIGSSNIAATGNSSADMLTAGAGTDTLFAGVGVDTMVGGSGNTTFVVNNTSDVVQDSSTTTSNTLQSSLSAALPSNVNTLILTGTSGLTGTANSDNDTLISNSGVDTLIGGAGNDTFILNNSSDVVQDSLGTATIIYTSNASFTLPASSNVLTLTGTAAISATGNAGNDFITGNAGADTLIAGSGVDTLVAGAGASPQSLVGGTGNDLIVVDNTADLVSVGSSHGTDTIESSVSYSAPANVADLTLTGTAAISATGNSLGNVLSANSGNDTLAAGSGIATLVGGAGNDIFVVDSASDVIQDTSTTSSNSVQASISYTLPSNVNSLVLTGTAALSGTSNGGNDTLTSNSGVDTLVGAFGTGPANNTFIVNNSADVVMESLAITESNIISSVSYSLPNFVDSLTLTGTAALVGTGNSDYADTLAAGAGPDTLIAGGATVTVLVSGTGVDSLVGGTGTNLFYVNNAADVVVGRNSSDSISASVSFTLPTTVKTLTLLGSSNLQGTAISGNNAIYANSGSDTLVAGSGNDTLYSGSAADTLIGGTGSTTFYVVSPTDVIEFNSSNNSIESEVSYTLPTQANSLTLEGNSNLIGVGNANIDVLAANAGNDTLVAGAGVASLLGGLGSDLFVINSTSDTVSDSNYGSKAGVDTIQSSVSYTLPTTVNVLLLTGSANLSASGNANADFIVGNAGADLLSAGTGNDTLVAGTGMATLVAGAETGNDTFVINNANDVVRDSVASHNNVLYSSASHSLPTNINSLILTGSDAVIATANAANDFLEGGGGLDTLVAGSGIDTLEAGSGLTTLVGGAGADTYIVNNAADAIQNASASASNVIFSSASYSLPTNVNQLMMTGDANISVTGNAASDTLTAGAGQDTLIAGSGLATLVGGSWNDTFVVNSTGDVVQDTTTGGNDVIQASANYSLVTNVNTLVLTGTAALTGTANGANDTLVSNGAVDTLVGGAGNETFIIGNAADAVLDTAASANNIAQSAVNYALATNVNTLILTGTSGLTGTANGGTDSLVSNAGADTLVGGSGRDTFVINNSKDVIEDTAASANNLVQSSVNFTLPTNVNSLTLIGTAALSGTGNSAGGIVTANSGNDTLTASSGATTLVGGAGADTFVVNSSGAVVQDSVANPQSVIQASVDYTLAQNVSELLLTGTGALVGTGNSGNATLASNSGVDTLVGGSGNDLFIVNNSADVIENATSNDTIESSVNYSLPSSVDTLILIGSANIAATGNGLSDSIVAGSGNDTLNDGSSNTYGINVTLIGGSGNDVFVVNNASDLVQNSSTTSSDTIQSSVSFSLPTDVDSLNLTGSSSLTATGNSDANNVLSANSGNDLLVGTAYADTINGGTGSDTIDAGPAVNLIYAGNGGTVVQPTLVYGNATGTNIGTQSTIYGGTGVDLLYGGPGSDVIYAGSGADTLTAGSGADTLYGGTGDELIDSQSGQSLLVAGSGAVTVDGTGGDTLSAGSGADLLNGGVGSVYQISAGFGPDTIGGGGSNSTIVFGAGITQSALTIGAAVEGGNFNPANFALVINDGSSSITVPGGFVPGAINAVTFSGSGTESFTQFMNSFAAGTTSIADGSESSVLSVGNGQAITDSIGRDYFIFAYGNNDTISEPIDLGQIFAYGNNDSISSAEWTTALGNSDSITISGSAAEALLEGSNDTLVAGSNEYFAVEQSSDVVQVAAGSGIDTLDSFVNYALPTNVQILTLDSTVGGLSGTSNAQGGQLIAGANSDTLVGGSGQDTLTAKGNNDVLIGGSGSETYVLHSSTDTIQFGSGAASLNAVQANFNYTLSSAANSLTEFGNNVMGTGNSANDVLTATGLYDVLVAGAGNDTLVDASSQSMQMQGGSGNDVFVVNHAGDIITDTSTTASNVIDSTASFTLPTNVNTLLLMGSGSLIAAANAGNDSITANAGNDTLIAGSGNDTLVAGIGTDTLVFNVGFGQDEVLNAQNGDVIEFGPGITQNSLTYTAVAGVAGSAPSLVIAGDGGAVTLQGGLVPGAISDVSFSGGTSATLPQLVAPSGRTTIAGANGNLILSPNNGDSVTGDSGEDTVIAWGNADTLHAGSGGTEIYAVGTGDIVTGGAGTDSLVADGANTTLVGGSGNENFVVNNASTSVQVSAGVGHDTMDSSVNYTLPANVSVMTLIGTAALQGTGNAGSDTLIANSGNSTLYGGSGADTLVAGNGAGTFVVNNAADVVISTSSTAQNVIDSLVNYTLPANVNVLNLNATGITGTGNAQNDVINANQLYDVAVAGSGNDSLYGKAQDVTIEGGSGNDLLSSSQGFSELVSGTSGLDTLNSTYEYDQLYVNNSSDVIEHFGAYDTLHTSVNYTAFVTAPTWDLTGSANLAATDLSTSSALTLSGNGGNDTLTANGYNNTFYDGKESGFATGSATMIGGPSANTFIVANTADVVVAQAASSDTVDAYVSYSLPANVNTLETEGSNLTATGNSGNDTLISYDPGLVIAGSGNDSLVSDNGGSTLVAGAGNDTLVPSQYGTSDVLLFNPGFGSDLIEAAASGPIVEFASGISESALTAAAALDVNGNAALTIADGADVITLNGALSGSSYQFNFAGGPNLSLGQFLAEVQVATSSIAGVSGNLILEGAASTAVTGGTGNDTIYAAGANDTVTAGSGAQVLDALGIGDSIVGGAGADTLSGLGANDTLVAGAAANTLIGGTGAVVEFVINSASDVIQLQSSPGADTVSSSASYSLPTNINALILTGTGALTGRANGGADTLVSNTGLDTLVGSTGNDTFVINNSSDVVTDTSSSASNTIQAAFSYSLPTDVNTLILTGTGALKGSANGATDTLISNSGLDTLVGGTGNDTFVVNMSSDVVTDTSGTASNTIQAGLNYSLPTDVNSLVLTGTAALVGTANGGTDTLTSNSAADTLIGGAGNDTFIVINAADVLQDTTTTTTNTVQSTVSFSLVTNVNSLTLSGTAALQASANNGTDTLTSNSGTDTLTGGSGNDTFVINNSGDMIQDTSTTAVNIARSAVSYSLATNVNTLVFSGTSALQGTANSGNDSLTANSGADTLVAGAGVDTLTSGTTGADSLVGGTGSDLFFVNNTSDIVFDTTTTTSNKISSSVAYSLPTNVNTLVFTGTAALKGIANSGNDSLTANSGADTLVAGAGTDTLVSGTTGADSLVGSSGNDTFFVNFTGDIVTDTSTSASNVISSTVTYVLPTNVNTLAFTGTAALKGTANSGNDSLTANTGADTLVAGSGTDTLVSGTTGIDSLVGGSGNDTFFVNFTGDVVTDTSTSANNTIQSSASYSLPTNVNTLILTGTGALSATGNAHTDSITANSGADTLTAGSGVATLIGGAGNDTFVINSASDVVTDTSTAASNKISSTATYSLPTNVNTLVFTGTAALKGTANSGNDSLTANTGADTLVAGSGIDTLVSGTTGADSLVGGSGSDTFFVNFTGDIVTDTSTTASNAISSTVNYALPTNVNTLTLTGTAASHGTGNAGNDLLTANSGADTLSAGNGTDTLVSGSSIDSLVGGTGSDTFVVNNASDKVSVASSTGNDTIQSTANFTLPTNVQYLMLSGTAALTGTGNTLLDLIVGNTGADTLTGSTGIAALEGGKTAGSDQIKASGNQAALIGGGGSSTLTGGAYKDFYAAGLVSDSITTGATSNVVSVNKGDGATTLQPTTGATNVLSLGAGIDTESLFFTKTGNNLILTDGVSGDSITFTNWYAGASDQDVTKLQVVEIASANYNSAGTDGLRNKALEDFNFTTLVAAFNTAGSPANWALSTAMPSAQLTSSSTADYGGDLAYYFGLNGNLTGVDLSAVQSTLTNSSYATAAQTIDSFSGISGGGGLHLLAVNPNGPASQLDAVDAATSSGLQTDDATTRVIAPMRSPEIREPEDGAAIASLALRREITHPTLFPTSSTIAVPTVTASAVLAAIRGSATPSTLISGIRAAGRSDIGGSYVDPINVAWSTMHKILDGSGNEGMGAEVPVEHIGIDADALLVSDASKPTQRPLVELNESRLAGGLRTSRF